MTEYDTRHGRTFAVGEIETPYHKSKRKQFKLEWTKLPLSWLPRLHQSRRTETYKLAHIILVEAIKCQYWGGEITLSTEVTGMTRSTKLRAARELARLGLVKIIRDGNKALRVIPLLYFRKKE
jgi:hypothetical protein